MRISNYNNFILEKELDSIIEMIERIDESIFDFNKIFNRLKNFVNNLYQNSSNPFETISVLWKKVKFSERLCFILILVLMVGCGVSKNEIFKNLGYESKLVNTVEKVEQVQQSKTHRVSDGETLYSISKIYGIRYTDIIHKNKLYSELIRPGQVLQIPNKEEIKLFDEMDEYPQELKEIESEVKELDKKPVQKEPEDKPQISDAHQESGFFEHPLIKNNRIERLELAPFKKVNAVVLHRTATKGLKGTLKGFSERKIGTHFLIGYDGTIYQTASVDKITAHVGEIRPRCIQDKTATSEEIEELQKVGWSPLKVHFHEIKKKYPERYPYNSDAIGIEVMGGYDRGDKEWESLTPKQIESVKFLVDLLKDHFNLSSNDVYAHEVISYKTANEGGDVLKAILNK